MGMHNYFEGHAALLHVREHVSSRTDADVVERKHLGIFF